MNYRVSDFVIRLKNAVLAKRRKVLVPYSRKIMAIGKVLVKEGFLTDLKEEVKDGKRVINVEICYEKSYPAITDVLIISKPSLRIYTRSKNILKVRKGAGVFLLSTNQGIMTNLEALKKGIGGEVLFKIW